MRKYYFVLFIAVSAIIISGCCSTRTEQTKGQVWVPVYKTYSDIRAGIKNEGAKDLKDPGKIYVYGNYLFINERSQGIHIINNQDPSNPKNIAFINIPGNGDIAVIGNILYADSYTDLVAFDITDPTNSKVVKRINDIFPNMLDPNGQYTDQKQGIIVKWDVKDTVYTYTYSTCDQYSVSPVDRGGLYDKRFLGADGSGSGSGTNSSGPSGVGGSMARFTIYKKYMYSVDQANLQVFDISKPDNPLPWARVNLGWNIETIFPYKDKLFIGSQTGMFIYDNTIPWNPTYLCEFRHSRGCDPVVANDKYAYVTLRSGTRCNNNRNELLIVDISTITNPKLIKEYPMQEPAGLGIDGTTLFICDGKSGLKVFDVTTPTGIDLLSWKSDFQTYDIIPLGDYAIIIGSDGLYQYDYKDPKNMVFLSKIPVTK